MKTLVAASLVLLATGCSRNPIEAVNLSNEGDKARAANIDEAISKYEQATQLDPSNHRIINKLATAYQKKEAWDKVASTLVRAEKMAPTHANFFFLHGHAIVKQADSPKPTAKWEEAKEPLLQAIKLDPNIADAYFDLAEVLLHADDEAGAMQNYTKAIEAKPDELTFYGPLAELYIANKFYEQAEQVLKEGLGFKKEGDKTAYILHSLMGQVKMEKGDISGSVADFEAAKKACDKCNEKGQQITFFNLGVAYSRANPQRKNEAIQQLQAFSKTVCRGSAAKRYEDECSQASEIVKQLGGTI
ncbi:MAG: tetratricopeptide repeat protein [Myxococcales bacterium]|nr:tetratricopeptide repeat protein [Myxococcales bacterium]